MRHASSPSPGRSSESGPNSNYSRRKGEGTIVSRPEIDAESGVPSRSADSAGPLDGRDGQRGCHSYPHLLHARRRGTGHPGSVRTESNDENQGCVVGAWFTQGLMVSAPKDRIDTNCSLEGKMGIGKRSRIGPPLGREPVHFLV